MGFTVEPIKKSNNLYNREIYSFPLTTHNFNTAFEEKKLNNYCVTVSNVSLWLVTNSDLCGNFFLSFFY